VGEPLTRHDSYPARIWGWDAGGVETITVPYCRQEGVPWPCEVEQRDREIEALSNLLRALAHHVPGCTTISAETRDKIGAFIRVPHG
jgi:hypothetical protein